VLPHKTDTVSEKAETRTQPFTAIVTLRRSSRQQRPPHSYATGSDAAMPHARSVSSMLHVTPEPTNATPEGTGLPRLSPADTKHTGKLERRFTGIGNRQEVVEEMYTLVHNGSVKPANEASNRHTARLPKVMAREPEYRRRSNGRCRLAGCEMYVLRIDNGAPARHVHAHKTFRG